MKTFPLTLALLAGLSGVLHAQTIPSAPAAQPRRGDLTGARPSPASRRQPATRPAANAIASTEADPVQQHLLQTTIDLTQARAEQLPELYERFIATTREERRQWSFADWDGASQVLARLNQRYEQVRTGLPLEERLRIRSFQGEFHTLRGAREVKSRVE